MLSHILRPNCLFSSTTALPVSSARRVAVRMAMAPMSRNIVEKKVRRMEISSISSMKTAKVQKQIIKR